MALIVPGYVHTPRSIIIQRNRSRILLPVPPTHYNTNTLTSSAVDVRYAYPCSRRLLSRKQGTGKAELDVIALHPGTELNVGKLEVRRYRRHRGQNGLAESAHVYSVSRPCDFALKQTHECAAPDCKHECTAPDCQARVFCFMYANV